MSQHALRCPLCISGMAPAGVDPEFGAVYRRCPLCQPRCLQCRGQATYPAIGGYFYELLIDAIYHLGYDIDVCRGCFGILTPPHTPTEATHDSAEGTH